MTPTIVLLLKAPRLGHVKTRLAATLGDSAATAVYRQMVEKQLAAIPEEWPVTVYYTPDDSQAEFASWLGPNRPQLRLAAQAGGDLGSRLFAAFATEFCHGAPTVLAVGGDCPALDQSMLQQAHQALTKVDAVLGPASDGGYYLLGLKEPCPELFQGISWSTPEVLVETREQLKRKGLSFSELPVLSDVDTAEDWRAAIAAGHLRPHCE